uniref:Lipocalin n=1 Tax=Rhipicephalus appendiculatus TaxID=34631 RepID=A0A131YSZ7_RHIAP
MCGVLTSGAALLFLISAGQWCNAEKGNMPEVSAPEASVSASPQEDVKGGRKHDFESFWENNNATLRLRTSDGLFHQCNWYERDSVNKTGVTLTEWTYIPTTPRWSQSFYGPRYWVFEGSNKMSWSSDEETTIKIMLYDYEHKCCVVEYEDHMYFEGASVEAAILWRQKSNRYAATKSQKCMLWFQGMSSASLPIKLFSGDAWTSTSYK